MFVGYKEPPLLAYNEGVKKGGIVMTLNELFGYEGKNVVVTGAFSGMGRAAARLLSELGANVYVVCRRNGRHSELDFPVTKVLHADLGVKEDLDSLIKELPSDIYAIFFCHGIALNGIGIDFPEDSNAEEVMKVNFLSTKYMIPKIIDKMEHAGSISIIASSGGYNWRDNEDNCLKLLEIDGYEDSVRWLENNHDIIQSAYVFSKECLNAYVVANTFSPMLVDHQIRINCLNPGNTDTGLKSDFGKYTSMDQDEDEGINMIEEIFIRPWNGYWASPEQMGYPLVCMGSKIFNYMSGQTIYLDYGISNTWLFNPFEY